MKWTPLILGSLYLAGIAACSGNRGDNSGAGTAGSGTESGSMQKGASGMMTDTAMSGGGGGVGDTAAVRSDSSTRSGATGSSMKSDTTGSASSNRTGTGKAWRSDSAKGNQTKSGVTNTKTGKSTLGKGVITTRPDQGQPVTSKGDTIKGGSDTNSAAQ
jgi:hypothetical protein